MHSLTDSQLTRLVGRVVIFDQEGVTVVPDLLAGRGVVVSDEGLQLRIKLTFTHDNIDGRLAVASWYLEGSLPHGMHWTEDGTC